MPVKRRRSKRRAPLTNMQMKWLRGEPSFYGLVCGQDLGDTIEEREATMAAVWADNRQWVLDAHIAEHPGTRPARWWEYDAPEPRPDGESEAEYLKRHGQLTAAERRGIAAPKEQS